MKNPKPLALVGAAALVLSAAYSVQSSSDDKAALRQAKQQYMQAKKDAVRYQAMQSATASNNQRVRGASNGDNGATPIALVRDGIAAAAAGAAASSGAGGAGCANFGGTIDPKADKDLFSVDLLAGDIVNISITSEGSGAPQDLFLTVTGPTNLTKPDCTTAATVAKADDENGQNMSTLDPCSFFQAAEAGTYFIQVEDLLGLTGGPAQTYVGTICVELKVETEPNDTTPELLALVADAVAATKKKKVSSSSSAAGCGDASAHIAGQLSSGADVDCYSLMLAAGQRLQCHVTGAECANDLSGEIDAQLTLTGAAGAFNDDADGSDPAILFTAPAAGAYVLCVNNHNAGLVSTTAFYSLHCDAGCSPEPAGNDGCQTAGPIVLPR